MNVSLKNCFRPTLDALEDRSLPSTGLSPTLLHHVHHVHQTREQERIEVERADAKGQAIRGGADDQAAGGETEFEQAGIGEVHHGGRGGD
jgi:hypothetical protein